MDYVWRYHSHLEELARSAAPGWGWWSAIFWASLPWIPAFLPALVVETFTSAPFWLVLIFWAVPMLIWLFVQLTMLAEISRMMRERR